MRHGVPRDTGLFINHGVAPVGFVSAMKSPQTARHHDCRLGAFLFLRCQEDNVLTVLNIFFDIATLSATTFSGICLKWVMA